MATTVSLKPNAVEISGSTSGTTTLQATAVAGTTTLTLPAATDTLVGKATTDTLTNKTLTGPTISGVATFAAGTAALPAITTTGDLNTGIWFPAADTIAFTEGGVESMRIDSSGNLGIGTTSQNERLRLNSSTAGQARLTIAYTDTPISYLGSYSGIAGSGNATDVILTSANVLAFGSGGTTEKMRLDSSGNLGIGNTTPFYKLDVSGYIRGVVSNASVGNASSAQFVQNSTGDAAISFLIGATTEWLAGVDNSDSDSFKINNITGGGDFNGTGITLTTSGNVSISGSLSKGSGSFRIDHPLPQLEETHQLVHSFIEGPQADLIYRGKVNLVNGTATVNIDTASTMTEGTFVMLCREVQCFTTNESGWNHVRGSVTGNILTIECQDQTASDLISWMVIGERKDKHMMDTDWTDDNGKVIVEPLKEQSSTTLEGA